MIKNYTIEYKGFRLTYYKTNYGSLFSARRLLALNRGRERFSNYIDNYISPELTVKLPFKGTRAVTCVGLKGFQQIFADCPDEVLERMLMLTGIVTGDLPAATDIKVEGCQDITQDNTQDRKTKDSFSSDVMVSEIKQLREQFHMMSEEVKKLRKEMFTFRQQLASSPHPCVSNKF